jgi:hypothetical protein
MSQIRKYSITFRPHINDNLIFEEVLPLIVKSLDRALEYFYTVEKDETIDRHLHAFIETEQRSDNFFRSIKKLLYDKFECTNTNLAIAWKVHKVEEEHDKLMVLGYQQKEKDFIRRGSNIDPTYLEKSEKYYCENKPPEIKNNLKIKFIEMNKNNIKSHILSFCEKNNEKINSEILRKMLKNGYCNSNIPQNSLRRIILECKVLISNNLTLDEECEYDKPIDWNIDENYDNLNLRQDLRKINDLILLIIDDPEDPKININSIIKSIQKITDKYI